MPNLSASTFPGPVRGGTWIKAVAAIVVVAGIGGGSYFGWQAYNGNKASAAQKVAREFVTGVTSGDPAHAYALTSVNVQRNSTQEQFEKNFSSLRSENSHMTQEVVSKTKSGVDYQATVDGLPATASGSTVGSFAIRLIRSGDTWQVDSVGVE